jgi:PilZ domain-containing protein
MTEEKRDAERVQIPGQVMGEVTVYEPMTIYNMSDSGAQIETKFALHLDSLHDFRLSLGARSVIVKGRIVHCQIGDLGEGGVLYRTGVEFVEPSEHALTAIRAFVEAKKLEAAAPPPIVEAEIADDVV